jgi:hypothetical protein
MLKLTTKISAVDSRIAETIEPHSFLTAQKTQQLTAKSKFCSQYPLVPLAKRQRRNCRNGRIPWSTTQMANVVAASFADAATAVTQLFLR